MSHLLVRGDALALPLADRSVHLVVTSPPYWSLRSYRDNGEHLVGQVGDEESPNHFLAALWAALDECWRVLRPDGSVFVNLGDKFAGSGGHNNANLSGLKEKLGRPSPRREAFDDQWKSTRRSAPDRYNQSTGGLRDKSRMLLPHRFALGLIDPEYRAFTEHRIGMRPTCSPQWVCRMDQVWSKSNGMPESVTDRVAAKHEYWFHLTKEGTYHADLGPLRLPTTGKINGATFGGQKAIGSVSLNGSSSRRMGGNTYDRADPRGKLPGSVWSVASEPLAVPKHLGLEGHFAAFPSEWPRRLILGWCPEGGTVLDPFVGTGTTVAVADALGRWGIGVDLSGDYLRLARWRIEDSPLVAKVRERTYGKPKTKRARKQTVGQLALFAEGA